MQITFDPLVPAEADCVRKMLGAETQTLTIGGVSAELTVDQMANLLRAGIQVAEEVDPDPQATAELRTEMLDRISDRADAPSAAPLPPDAPLPAAADLFSTAPVAPPAGEANATPVPPPPVPTAPAPAAPTASAGPTLPAGTVDKDGLPHDPRIHSGTKVTNADGTWRKRRGVDDALVTTVEAELRALMAIPAPGAAPVSAVPLPPSAGTVTVQGTSNPTVAAAPIATAAASHAVPATPSSHPADVSPVIPPAPAAAVAEPAGNVPPPPVPAPPTSAPATAPIPSPPAPPTPTAAADGAPPTFAGLMRKVSGHLTVKTLTPEQVDEAMATVHLTRAQMNLLAARPDLVEAVDAYINSLVMGAAS